MSAAPVFLETFKCHWCQKHRPKFRVHKLESNQIICDYCLMWQQQALDVLGGAPPRGCQYCLTTWEVLKERSPGEQVRMYVLSKDGILQLLCKDCVKVYLPKTAELYKGTQFGSESLKLL